MTDESTNAGDGEMKDRQRSTRTDRPSRTQPSNRDFECRIKEPGFAGVFSLIIPGAGQIYNEQFVRGTAILVAYVAYWWLSTLLTIVLVGFLMLMAIPLIHLGASWDALDQSRKINDGSVRI